MDEYYCKARPHVSSTDCDAPCDNDPYLDIEFDHTTIRVSNDGMFPFISLSETKCHVFSDLSEDKVIQNATIISWLSDIGIPEEAFNMAVEEVSQCVSERGNGLFKNLRGLSIRLSFSDEEGEEEMEVGEDEDNTLIPPVTRSIEDGQNEIDYQDDWDCYWREEMEIEAQEDDGLTPSVTRTIEDDPGENDYGDELNYIWEENMGMEEDNRSVIEVEVDEDDSFVIEVGSDEDEWNYGWEEVIGIEEDIRFVPAAKSCIVGLKMVTVKEAEKCPICLEDFYVAVCMPCSHMFHMNCIDEWLNVGNSCPLCRFQLPTSSTN